MGKTKWSSLANQHAMVTVATLWLGALISFIGKFNLWPIGIYACILGFVVLLLEYPRSDRVSEKTPGRQTIAPRPFQFFLAELFTKFGSLYANYFSRFIVYFTLSLPCFFTLSTLIPALNLWITAFLYLMGYYKKEKWIKLEKKSEKYSAGTIINAPVRPPPRSISQF